MKNNLGTPNWSEIRCFFLRLPFSFKTVSLVFLDIAQDCSLGQCLRSSRAETSKKKKKKKKIVARIGAEMILSILILLSVLSNLLVSLSKEDIVLETLKQETHTLC